MTYQKTNKPNGRPLSERNIQIIADSKKGMTSKELSVKYGITHGYAQKLASEYKRKDRLKVEEMHTSGTTLLYAERDANLLLATKSIAKRITAQHEKPSGDKNNGYLMRLQNEARK